MACANNLRYNILKLNRIISNILPNEATNPLECPMVFVTGPRQVGKTFLTKETGFPYFNWDTVETKRAWLKDPYFFRSTSSWVIFDEIHKRRDWKRQMKGFFDSPDRRENFLMTGSGRFNISHRGGDSLQGRYDLYHLLPVLYREFAGFRDDLQIKVPDFFALDFNTTVQNDQDLIEYGGFPEPLLKASTAKLKKWQDLYIQRLVNEDIRDFSKVQYTDKIELLARILPERVTAPISHKSLSEDVEVSRDSIKSWLRIFEILYLGFQLPPFSRKIHRAIKKEQKWYFFQWTYCEDEGARFENYVAVQLYSLCQLWRDMGLGVYELFYLRDQDKREVDFVITKALRPVALIEAKLSETNWPSSLEYYSSRLNIPSFVVTKNSPIRRFKGDRWIVPSRFLLNALLNDQ